MALGGRARGLLLVGGIVLATVAGFVLLARDTAAGAMEAATSPDWKLLAGSFAIAAAVQPLRAYAWALTLQAPIGRRAIYAASAIGSFLDTVLPGRLGEASKVAVLRVAAGKQWPGVARAGGSLVASHLLEAAAFCMVGGVAVYVLPFPGWARGATLGALSLALGGLVVCAVLHKRIGRRFPRIDKFLAAAALPRPLLLRVTAILVGTWAVRWIGILLLLNAVGVKASLGAALVYMILTGLANTAPLLPGNAGVYQGAAVGALALVGHAGETALAASVVAPILASVATAAAALIGIALFGRRFMTLPRAALGR